MIRLSPQLEAPLFSLTLLLSGAGCLPSPQNLCMAGYPGWETNNNYHGHRLNTPVRKWNSPAYTCCGKETQVKNGKYNFICGIDKSLIWGACFMMGSYCVNLQTWLSNSSMTPSTLHFFTYFFSHTFKQYLLKACHTYTTHTTPQDLNLLKDKRQLNKQ